MKSFRTSFINLMKVLGAFVKLNGMTSHSYSPSFILNVVFYSSPSLIQIWWYPLFKSIFEKNFAPLKQSIKSSILGNGNLYLMVILLISLESIHILQPLSFFGLSTVGTTHGLKLSRINPLSIKSWTYLLTSSFSCGINLYTDLFGKLALGIRSIWWLILLIGGNEQGILSTTISANSSNNF